MGIFGQECHFFVMRNDEVALWKWSVWALIRAIAFFLLSLIFSEIHFLFLRFWWFAFLLLERLVDLFCILLNFHPKFFYIRHLLIYGRLFFFRPLQVLKINLCLLSCIKKVIFQFLDFLLYIIMILIFWRIAACKFIIFGRSFFLN